jgi:UDP-2,4-diacetamido-2,4,6-trideoxy-beta-L-altropyranose hydrolase
MPTGSPSVTFRVDAQRKNGLGHLRRCLTLADELRVRGCATRIVCSQPLVPSVAALVGAHRVLCIGDAVRAAVEACAADAQEADAAATVALLRADHDASWVVVDSYELGLPWERVVSAAGYRVVAIDDFRDRPHCADVLVSDVELPFDPRLNQRHAAQTLVGREYTLIGPEYAYRAGSAPRIGRARLLISYGGSDPTGETAKALAALDTLSPRARQSIARVDIVVGQFNPNGDEIATAARRIAGARVHVSPVGLASLLQDSDLFLTAGGNSLAEALALRKPCLVTVTADNQELMVSGLAADGIIHVIGTHGNVGAAEVAAAITVACADIAAFAARVVAHPVFDHLGARRIADIMLTSRMAARPTNARTAGRRSE